MNYPDGITSIKEILKKNPRGMSVTDIADVTGINRNTVSRYLDMLLISGQAEMKTYGRAKVFYLSQRVPMSSMLDFTKDMVIVLDNRFRITQINDEVTRFTGKEKNEIVGKEVGASPLSAFDHPIIHERLEEGIRGKETVEEIRFMRVDGEHIFRFKIIPTVFEDGDTGVTLILEDITEQKHAEEALRESEYKFRTLVEEINDVICNVDEEGFFSYVSPKITDLTGFSPSDLEGKKANEFLLSGKETSDLFIGNDNVESDGRLIKLGLRTNNGGEVPVEASISQTHDIIGEFSSFRLVIRDIAERERSERVLKKWKSFLFSVVENIPSMVLVKSVDENRYVYINKSAEEKLGIKKEELVKIYNMDREKSIIPEIIDKDDLPECGEGRHVGIDTLRIEFPSGEIMMGQIKKIPIYGSSGKMKYKLFIIDPS